MTGPGAHAREIYDVFLLLKLGIKPEDYCKYAPEDLVYLRKMARMEAAGAGSDDSGFRPTSRPKGT